MPQLSAEGKARIRAYCEQPDHRILVDIIANTVPEEVMNNIEAWARVSGVKVRNKSLLAPGTWKAVCIARGGGPYTESFSN